EQLSDIARQNNTSLFSAVPLMSGKGGSNLARFADLVQQMAYEAQVLSLPELIEHVIHHSGLRQHYLEDKEGQDRLENLQELVNAAAVFAGEEGVDGLPAGRMIERAIDYGLQPFPDGASTTAVGGQEVPATEFLMSPL